MSDQSPQQTMTDMVALPSPNIQIVSSLAEFRVEEKIGWSSQYRLVHNASGQMTNWTTYEGIMMLIDQDGNHRVCVSPYYTDFEDFKMFTPIEALRYLCVVEAKSATPGAPMDDIRGPEFEVDEPGLEKEHLDESEDDIPGT